MKGVAALQLELTDAEDSVMFDVKQSKLNGTVVDGRYIRVDQNQLPYCVCAPIKCLEPGK